MVETVDVGAESFSSILCRPGRLRSVPGRKTETSSDASQEVPERTRKDASKELSCDASHVGRRPISSAARARKVAETVSGDCAPSIGTDKTAYSKLQ